MSTLCCAEARFRAPFLRDMEERRIWSKIILFSAGEAYFGKNFSEVLVPRC